MPRDSNARKRSYRKLLQDASNTHGHNLPSVASQTPTSPHNAAAQTTSTAAEQSTKRIAAGLKPASRPEHLTEAMPTATPYFYPTTSLLSLPPEIRLMIYDVLWETALVHVHTRTASGDIPQAGIRVAEEFRAAKLTWTPCVAVDLVHPCLCAHPVWDGTVGAEERCSDLPSTPNRPTGVFALRWTCKELRRELGNAHQHRAVFSPEHTWLYRLRRFSPETLLKSITRLRLSGSRFKMKERDGSISTDTRFMVRTLFSSRNPYTEVAAMFPSLTEISIQGFLINFEVKCMLSAIHGGPMQPYSQRTIDNLKRMFTCFNRRTNVVLDVSYRPYDRQEIDDVADIERFIITRPGVASGIAPEEFDWTACELEYVPFAKEVLQPPL